MTAYPTELRRAPARPTRADLVERYGGPAPRYTSYPTANHFGALESDAAQNALAGAGPQLHVYAHIPYCRQLCWYCGCNTVIRRKASLGDQHVDLLLAELQLRVPHLPEDATFHGLDLGGGTPNFLSSAALHRLVDGIRWVFDTPEKPPILGTELDPRTVADDQLETLLELGFTKFSIGVQSLDPAVQIAVNRRMDRERPSQILRTLRAGGGTSLNVDLMVGLPYQTPTTLLETLDTLLHDDEAAPDRLAVFQYAHMPRLRPAQKHLERAGLPGAAARDAMLRTVTEHLVDAGYQRIGFDHFARPDDPLAIAARTGRLTRNFQGFTTGGDVDLLALGPSAIGKLGGLYTQNHRDPGAWRTAVENGTDPVVRGIRQTPEDVRLGGFIHALFCDGLALWDMHGVLPEDVSDALAALQPMVADGIVHVDDNGVQVLPAGTDFVRQIAAAFDPWLRDRSSHSAVA